MCKNADKPFSNYFIAYVNNDKFFYFIISNIKPHVVICVITEDVGRCNCYQHERRGRHLKYNWYWFCSTATISLAKDTNFLLPRAVQNNQWLSNWENPSLLFHMNKRKQHRQTWARFTQIIDSNKII